MLWNQKNPPGDGHPASNGSFKAKVDAFWEGFSSRAADFYGAIEEGKCGDLQPEVSAMVEELWAPFAWVFGPGPEDQGGHSFTLSGEGLIHRQFLAEYWLSRAPNLEGWTFYASRQPGESAQHLSINIEDNSFEFQALWVTPKIDTENEIVDVTAWHPLFDKVSKDQKNTVLFLMLDEVLGEHGTDQWLGEIETSDTELAGAIPVAELREFLHQLEVERGWTKLPPTQSYSNYQMKEPHDGFPRADTVVGSTCNFPLIGDFLDSEGPIEEDPIGGSGADFVYVSFPSSILPQGGEVDFRGEIEEQLTDVLEPVDAGLLLGGAIGVNETYIDLLLFDGDRSLDLAHDVLVKQGLPEGTGIQFFAAGNEGRRRFI